MADISPGRIAEFIEPFRVRPGRRARLPHDFDPRGTRKRSRTEAKEILAAGVEMLAEYQSRLAAQAPPGVEPDPVETELAEKGTKKVSGQGAEKKSRRGKKA